METAVWPWEEPEERKALHNDTNRRLEPHTGAKDECDASCVDINSCTIPYAGVDEDCEVPRDDINRCQLTPTWAKEVMKIHRRE